MDWDAAQKREAEFLSREGDAAAVYRFDEEVMTDRSVPLEWARLVGKSPMVSGYSLIAAGPIMRGAKASDILDEYRANGFVEYGDIVAFKQGGVLECWYIAPMFYHLLPGLLENHLKSAELSTEQNANQIDGIMNNTVPSPQELATEDDALFVVDGTTFLHIETSEGDRNYTREDCCVIYYYTLYDKETLRKLDGGWMEVVSDIRDDPWQIHQLAARNILECRTALVGSSLELVSTDLVKALQDSSIWVMDRMEHRSKGKALKPSLRDNLKQCQREAADCSRGSGSPGRHSPGKER